MGIGVPGTSKNSRAFSIVYCQADRISRINLVPSSDQAAFYRMRTETNCVYLYVGGFIVCELHTVSNSIEAVY